MTCGNQTGSYQLRAKTSGQAGLQKFTDTLVRRLSVQDRIKAQDDVIAGLQGQIVPAVAASSAQMQEEIRLARELTAAKKPAANDHTAFRTCQLTEEEQAEKAAYQARMQRLKDANATAILTAWLSGQAE